MPTVAITDYTFSNLDVEQKILADVEIVSGQCKTAETLIPLVADADAVITQFAPLTADVVAAMNRAKVIVRYGIGVDNVALDEARNRNIPVCNVPDYCIDEVADHTLAFILATTRQVVPNCLHIRAGQWGLATELSQMRTLRQQTVGLVGLGRIGREVAARLFPFKCRILAYDPMASDEAASALGCERVELDQLLVESDIISLHCPSTDKTRRLINADSIKQMKTGSILINLGRGDLVETTALVDALKSGQLSAAAIDVCDPEPIPADSPLRSMPNVIAASHIASASPSAVGKLRQAAASIALAALKGESLPNIVNGL